MRITITTAQVDGETRRIVRSVGKTELAKLVKIDHSPKMRLMEALL